MRPNPVPFARRGRVVLLCWRTFITALLIHEHNVAQISEYRGSIKGHVRALDRKREISHV
jgi:hypothetical protein